MWIADMVRGIILTWNGILASITDILTTNPTEWADGAAWDIAAAVHEGLRGVAYGLMVLFWAISFFRYIDDLHKIDAREMIGWILRFVLIYTLMEVSLEIMTAVLGLAADVNSIVLDQGLGIIQFEVPEDLLAAVEGVNTVENPADLLASIGAFFQALPLSILFFVLLIAVLVACITLVVTIYLRFFRLYIYTAIAPLPLSTFTGHKISDSGWHFIRSYAAVCLEVCVISLALLIFNAAVTSNGFMFEFLVTPPGADDNSILWNESINWSVSFLIEVSLLVIAVKEANRWIEKIIGA